jgi:hypothetical protein
MESVDVMLNCVFAMTVLLTIPSLASTQAQTIPSYSTYTNNPAPSWLLNKDIWLTSLVKHGAIITTINNDANYLSNSRALVVSYVNGSAKQLTVVANDC